MLTVETHLTTRDDAIQGRNRRTCASPAPRRGRPTHRGRGVLDVEGRAAAFIDGGGRRQAATTTAGARRSAGHAAPMHGSRPERERGEGGFPSDEGGEARGEGPLLLGLEKTTTVPPAVATTPAKKTQLRNDPGGEAAFNNTRTCFRKNNWPPLTSPAESGWTRSSARQQRGETGPGNPTRTAGRRLTRPPPGHRHPAAPPPIEKEGEIRDVDEEPRPAESAAAAHQSR